ncbi:hypothetical protein AZ044_005461, partial [Pluralibacter gergoviae]
MALHLLGELGSDAGTFTLAHRMPELLFEVRA